VTRECGILSGDLPRTVFDGAVLLIGDFNQRDTVGPLMALTSSDEQPWPIPGVPLFWYFGEASPQGTYFAYDGRDNEDQGYSTLVVLDGSTEVVSQGNWRTHWRSPQWLAERQLIFSDVDPAATLTSELVNIPPGEIDTRSNDLPDYFIVPTWEYGRWLPVYDSSLTLIAYIAGTTYADQRFVLWDSQVGTELWAIRTQTAAYTRPVWSPDGTRLAVAVLNELEDDWNRFELYLVHRQGGAQKWIDIRDYFASSSTLHMKWSPDGRYLAISPESDRDSTFLLLDTATERLLHHCISSNAYGGKILWSPDSSRVIVPRYGFRSILLDLHRSIAGDILRDDDFGPLAWLHGSP
jgi:hypothetical protein